jgi:hypothetical protein
MRGRRGDEGGALKVRAGPGSRPSQVGGAFSWRMWQLDGQNRDATPYQFSPSAE